MDITHTNRRHLKLIGWTVFCLVIGFLAATILGPLPAPDAQTSPVLPTAPGSFSQLAKKASPSVVNISAVKVIKGRGSKTFSNGFSEIRLRRILGKGVSEPALL
ncbi:MAG: hypothetical protein JRF21_04015 [Deltaproteobacteria bacterium]|nr:hypothetical protein [Deltaproteobacteria bacterium]